MSSATTGVFSGDEIEVKHSNEYEAENPDRVDGEQQRLRHRRSGVTMLAASVNGAFGRAVTVPASFVRTGRA